MSDQQNEQRRRFTAQENVAVLRQHLVEKMPISQVCDRHGLNPAAARSLAERFEETLTVHPLPSPEFLRQSLRSTNIIESCFSRTRNLCRNVKRRRSANLP